MHETDISICIEGLKDPDKNVRAHNMNRIADYGKPAIPSLVLLLKDPDWVVRYRACEALGLIQDPETLESLIEMTRDERDHVRYMATKSLVKMNDPRILPNLIGLLSDEHSYTRKIAASGLSNFQDNRALDPLQRALENEGDSSTRDALYEAILKLKKKIT